METATELRIISPLNVKVLLSKIGMVERAWLSQSIVDATDAPKSGERWISDTKIPGFGLRVWRKADGSVGKAYCVRASDITGRPQRRTLDITSLFDWRLLQWNDERFPEEAAQRDIGRFVEEARSWAQDTVDKMKGKLTLVEQEKTQREAYKSSAKKRTLRRVADVLLKGHIINGASQRYVDRLDKLFSLYVETEVANSPVSSLSKEQVHALANFKDVAPGNLKFIRPFLRKIFELDSLLSCSKNYFETAIFENGYFQVDEDQPENPLSEWSRDAVDEFLLSFLSEDAYWQQGICLYFYFSFMRAPLSQVLAFRWDQLYELTPRSHQNDIETPGIKLAWCYRDKGLYRESISRNDVKALKLAQSFSQQKFPNCCFLFPSPFGDGNSHIKSVDHVWAKTLKKYDLSYLSPRAFKRMLDENSYYRFRFLYGEHRQFGGSPWGEF